MSWIEIITPGAAIGRLAKLYARIRGPNGAVDNIMQVHSLRPHSMDGHMALYKNVLHHSANTLPKWYLETIGIWVSLLNACTYCVEHHYAGLCRHLEDELHCKKLRAALETGVVNEAPLTERERAGLRYAEKLTRAPHTLQEGDILRLRQAAFSDGEILEINQVTAYFAYANRTVLGLGVSTEGDVLGLSPGNSGDPSDWAHG